VWKCATAFVIAGVIALPSAAASSRFDPARPRVRRDAVQLLVLGPEYLEGVELQGEESDGPPAFDGLDTQVYSFLRYPLVQPAVWFGCGRYPADREARFVEALGGTNDRHALQALAILMHVRAPRYVPEQWQTLLRLRKAHPRWASTLRRFFAAFAEENLLHAIGQNPSTDPFARDYALNWAIRAVGVTQRAKALPRLAELCAGDSVRASLAAWRSIGDFTGHASNTALATCVTGWPDNAGQRALDTLIDRDPDLARRTLVVMPLPPGRIDGYASRLSSLADTSAVPRLIEAFGAAGQAQGDVLQALELHAQPEHRPLLRTLLRDMTPQQRRRLLRLIARLPLPPAGEPEASPTLADLAIE